MLEKVQAFIREAREGGLADGGENEIAEQIPLELEVFNILEPRRPLVTAEK